MQYSEPTDVVLDFWAESYGKKSLNQEKTKAFCGKKPFDIFEWP